MHTYDNNTNIANKLHKQTNKQTNKQKPPELSSSVLSRDARPLTAGPEGALARLLTPRRAVAHNRLDDGAGPANVTRVPPARGKRANSALMGRVLLTCLHTGEAVAPSSPGRAAPRSALHSSCCPLGENEQVQQHTPCSMSR